jgi:hypothetical protein
LRFARSSDSAARDAGTTSDHDGLEELLRQNLKLRGELGAEIVKASYRSASQRGEGSLGSDEVPETSPVKDDLEGLRRELRFRRELKLRRELEAELPRKEGNSHKSGGGVAYRFGEFLYWACLMLGLIWIALCLFLAINSSVEQNQLLTPATLAVILVPPLLLHGIGRDLRFVLSGRNLNPRSPLRAYHRPGARLV